jgi:hypothetical protein
MLDMRESVSWIFVAGLLVTQSSGRTPKRKAELILSESSASGAAGGSDTEGKAAKGSGERGGSRESFKSAVVKKLGGWNGWTATLEKYLSPVMVGSKRDFRFKR